MLASVQALFTGIIDYAGLFPPAKLPLDVAIRNYHRYRQEPESWMLGRFVCPAARLVELAPFADKVFPPGRLLSLVVLGSGDPCQDITAIMEIHTCCPGRIDAASYECKWTGREAELQLHGSGGALVFFEFEFALNWRREIADIVGLLAGRKHGLKLRCGGETPAALPTPEQVAHVLVKCRDAAIPMKFTAGLHHPIRHLDARLGAKQHGFLNMFGAGVLARARNLDEEQVRRIVEEEDAASFHFADDGFGCKDWSASVAEMVAARRDFVTSFGSCSFEEPVADLRGMGLVD